jgi:acetolactate synthase-1/3 small subunit
MRHIISVLVENEFGVLAKISGLFSGRGFNIESLCVAETTDPTVSRITLVTSGDDRVLEQITKHLNKLVNVIQVCDFSTVEPRRARARAGQGRGGGAARAARS